MAAAVASTSQLTMDQNNVPAWGSYLYQNFLLPAFSPNIASQWLASPFTSNNGNTNANDPSGADQQQQQQQLQNGGAGYSGNPGVPGDYFGSAWQIKSEPGLDASSSQQQAQPPMLSAQSYQTLPPTYSQSQQLPQAAPQSQSQSQHQQAYNFFGGSIPTSLLTANQPSSVFTFGAATDDKKTGFNSSLDGLHGFNHASGSRSNSLAKISPSSVEVIDEIVASPSPLLSSRNSPHQSPKKGKRRALSIDSNEDHYADEHDHEVPEGVERDGMIWGMKVEDYRALSARERKRVRNRISARTFRAKRKGESPQPPLSTHSVSRLTLVYRTPQLARDYPQLERHSDQARPRRRRATPSRSRKPQAQAIKVRKGLA